MKLVRPDVRSAVSVVDHQDDDEIPNSNEIPLTRDVQSAFSRHFGNVRIQVPSHARPLKRYRAQGVLYTVNHVHEGNGGVLCQGSDVPYRIENILEFSHSIMGEHIWFVIRAHRPANVKHDPYTAYPLLRAKMWGVDHETSIHIIPLSYIEGHFAKCVIPWEDMEVAVCVSLSRTQPF